MIAKARPGDTIAEALQNEARTKNPSFSRRTANGAVCGAVRVPQCGSNTTGLHWQ
jgi:hypothetical protein